VICEDSYAKYDQEETYYDGRKAKIDSHEGVSPIRDAALKSRAVSAAVPLPPASGRMI
jgi:hypothetical protein